MKRLVLSLHVVSNAEPVMFFAVLPNYARGEVEMKDYSSTLARGEAPITHHGRLAVQLWAWDPTIPRQARTDRACRDRRSRDRWDPSPLC